MTTTSPPPPPPRPLFSPFMLPSLLLLLLLLTSLVPLPQVAAPAPSPTSSPSHHHPLPPAQLLPPLPFHPGAPAAHLPALNPEVRPSRLALRHRRYRVTKRLLDEAADEEEVEAAAAAAGVEDAEALNSGSRRHRPFPNDARHGGAGQRLPLLQVVDDGEESAGGEAQGLGSKRKRLVLGDRRDCVNKSLVLNGQGADPEAEADFPKRNRLILDHRHDHASGSSSLVLLEQEEGAKGEARPIKQGIKREKLIHGDRMVGFTEERRLLSAPASMAEDELTSREEGRRRRGRELSTPLPIPSSPSFSSSSSSRHSLHNANNCKDVRQHLPYPDSCSFVKAEEACHSQSFLDYTRFFFCTCKNAPVLGYLGLLLWLLALFYMLGNTAAEYFCCTLKQLAELLQLSPAIAGVTLLAFSNGAPDVFASVIAFSRSGSASMGLSSALGGSIFVTTIVSGSLGLVTCARSVTLDRGCFLRDVCFFLVALCALFVFVLDGSVYLFEAITFLCIYVVYAAVVVVGEIVQQRNRRTCSDPLLEPLLNGEASRVPQWSRTTHVATYGQQDAASDEEGQALWGAEEAMEGDGKENSWRLLFRYTIELPLTLPRQLTIPIIDRDRWSRPIAVAAAVLFPLFLVTLWKSTYSAPPAACFAVFAATLGVAIALGLLMLLSTEANRPPRTFLLLWLAAGFLMSLVWSYLVAQELVAVLVSLGVVFNVNTAVLGLTVLAWGNSMSDLVGNLSLACRGRDGVQIAISGCYAGPLFNTVMGLGISFTIVCWRSHPAPFSTPRDPTVIYTIGFLVAGLLWALVLVPCKRMQLGKCFGLGLLILYGSFIVGRLGYALGWIDS